MFPENLDCFVQTVLFEMDLQIEYGENFYIGEWTFIIDDDFDDDDGIAV